MSTRERLEERNFILECIKLYKSLPALWNTKSKVYSNRDKKNQQYETLLRKFKERYPKADKADLTKKFNSLRTNFRKELKKMRACKEDEFEPTLWYFDEMKFLLNTGDNGYNQNGMSDDGELNETEAVELRISKTLVMGTSKEKQFWLEFLELYKSKPELWKIKCVDYKNRVKKHLAYDALIEKCKEVEPTANKDFVTKKINCMRSAYRREFKKVNDSLKSGEEYVPSLWYFKFLGFLRDQEESLEGESIGLDSENDNGCEIRNEIEPKFKKKKTNSSTDELVRLVTNRLKSREDSCHHLGNAWGNKLSKMDRNQRIIAEKVITEVMFNGELGLLNFNTTLTNISSVRKLKSSSSSLNKHNTIINSSESSLDSTPTNNYTTDIVRQNFSAEVLSYASPSPPLENDESITDHENEHTEQNFVVEEYDPLDNSVKMED